MHKTVLVTGGARRIGRAICLRLAHDGWRVIIHARNVDDADALSLAKQIGGNVVEQELGDELAAGKLFNKVVKIAPEICAVVNNAAVFNTAQEMSPAQSALINHINYEVPERLMTMLATRLMTNKDAHCAAHDKSIELPHNGACVHLLDARVIEGDVKTAYEQSKFALMGTVREGAVDFAEVLRVNGVAPGYVLAPTNMEARECAAATILGYRPTPEDVADAVAYLLNARAVTGQIISVTATC